jgi:hypothetical protein
MLVIFWSKILFSRSISLYLSEVEIGCVRLVLPTFDHLGALRLAVEVAVFPGRRDVEDRLHFAQFALVNLMLLIIPLLV